MTKILRNAILRGYIALAREEGWTPSEIGETIDYVAPYSGREIGSYLVIQKGWSFNEKFRAQYCAAFGITDYEFFEQMIVPKPSRVCNLIYSMHLRRVYGLGLLRFMPEFDKDGNFKLPSYRGYLKPKRDGKFITELEFSDMRFLQKRAA